MVRHQSSSCFPVVSGAQQMAIRPRESDLPDLTVLVEPVGLIRYKLRWAAPPGRNPRPAARLVGIAHARDVGKVGELLGQPHASAAAADDPERSAKSSLPRASSAGACPQKCAASSSRGVPWFRAVDPPHHASPGGAPAARSAKSRTVKEKACPPQSSSSAVPTSTSS